MEKYRDIIRHLLDLSDSCVEGIEYIQTRLDTGDFDPTVSVCFEVVDAIYTMDHSYQTVLLSLGSSDMETVTYSLWNSLELVVSAYEQRNHVKAYHAVADYLLPHYKAWKLEMENGLQSYLLS
jgi:hypothetical protein